VGVEVIQPFEKIGIEAKEVNTELLRLRAPHSCASRWVSRCAKTEGARL
jgi:hypothetical protein